MYNLRTHIKLHDRVCSEVCRIPGCGAKFATNQLLCDHMKKQHSNDKQYRLIPFSFFSFSGVHIHINLRVSTFLEFLKTWKCKGIWLRLGKVRENSQSQRICVVSEI